MIFEYLKKIALKRPTIKKLLFPVIEVRRYFRKKRYERQKKVLTNLGKVLIGDPTIAVDAFKGVFSLDIQSDLFANIIIAGNYEEQLVRYCEKFIDADKDAIDVGANNGLYSVLFAKNINNRRVLAIEPAKNALHHLRHNIKINGVEKKIEIFEGVVTDKNGPMRLKTVRGKEEYSSLGEMAHPSISKSDWVYEDVVSTILDELVQCKSLNPGFIKIDVEGSEHLVVKGAPGNFENL